MLRIPTTKQRQKRLKEIKLLAKKLSGSKTAYDLIVNGTAVIESVCSLFADFEITQADVKRFGYNGEKPPMGSDWKKRLPLVRAPHQSIQKQILAFANQINGMEFTVDDVLENCAFKAKTNRKIVGAVLHSLATRGKKPLKLVSQGKRGPKPESPVFAFRDNKA